MTVKELASKLNDIERHHRQLAHDQAMQSEAVDCDESYNRSYDFGIGDLADWCPDGPLLTITIEVQPTPSRAQRMY